MNVRPAAGAHVGACACSGSRKRTALETMASATNIGFIGQPQTTCSAKAELEISTALNRAGSRISGHDDCRGHEDGAGDAGRRAVDDLGRASAEAARKDDRVSGD